MKCFINILTVLLLVVITFWHMFCSEIAFSLVLLTPGAQGAGVFPSGPYVALEQSVFRGGDDFGTGYG